MEEAKQRKGALSHTRSIAYVGLTIAIMAVSAWVTVPIGPVPLTLQMFAFTFAIVLLTPSQCIAAVAGYLLLGAVGVPVFSGMRGGIGVLSGVTGGYLWGYLLGAAAAVLFLSVVRQRMDAKAGCAVRDGSEAAVERASAGMGAKVILFLRNAGFELMAGVIFTGIAYLCGWAQYMVVAHVSAQVAFWSAIAPFIVVDLVKIVVAVICARSVKTAIS